MAAVRIRLRDEIHFHHVVGAAIATRVMKGGEVDSTIGVAAQIPNEPLVLGVTDRRLLIWGWGKMMGKPKDLKFTFALSEIAGMEIEPKKASVAVALIFSDGSGITREAPKLANDPEGFAAALNGLTSALS